MGVCGLRQAKSRGWAWAAAPAAARGWPLLWGVLLSWSRRPFSTLTASFRRQLAPSDVDVTSDVRRVDKDRIVEFARLNAEKQELMDDMKRATVRVCPRRVQLYVCACMDLGMGRVACRGCGCSCGCSCGWLVAARCAVGGFLFFLTAWVARTCSKPWTIWRTLRRRL